MRPPPALTADERAQALTGMARIEDQLSQAADYMYARDETKAAMLLHEAASEVAAAGWALVRSGQPALAGQAAPAQAQIAASPGVSQAG